MAPNLDKHPIQRRVYIAYDAQGFAFRVVNALEDGRRLWRAIPSHAGAATDPRRFGYKRLGDIAARIGESSRIELPADDSGLRNFAS